VGEHIDVPGGASSPRVSSGGACSPREIRSSRRTGIGPPYSARPFRMAAACRARATPPEVKVPSPRTSRTEPPVEDLMKVLVEGSRSALPPHREGTSSVRLLQHPAGGGAASPRASERASPRARDTTRAGGRRDPRGTARAVGRGSHSAAGRGARGLRPQAFLHPRGPGARLGARRERASHPSAPGREAAPPARPATAAAPLDPALAVSWPSRERGLPFACAR